MKVYYFNDEQKKVAVYSHDLVKLPFVLEPATGRQFEVKVPDKCILFIKKWKGIVLLSWLYELEEDEGDERKLPEGLDNGS